MLKFAKKENETEACLICDEHKQHGIRIWQTFICEACEKKVITTDTNDSRYIYYLKRLEKVKKALHT